MQQAAGRIVEQICRSIPGTWNCGILEGDIEARSLKCSFFVPGDRNPRRLDVDRSILAEIAVLRKISLQEGKPWTEFTIVFENTGRFQMMLR